MNYYGYFDSMTDSVCRIIAVTVLEKECYFEINVEVQDGSFHYKSLRIRQEGAAACFQ